MRAPPGHFAFVAAVQQRLGVELHASLEPRLMEGGLRLVSAGHAAGLTQLAHLVLRAPEEAPVLQALRQAVALLGAQRVQAPGQLARLGALVVEPRGRLELGRASGAVACGSGFSSYGWSQSTRWRRRAWT